MLLNRFSRPTIFLLLLSCISGLAGIIGLSALGKSGLPARKTELGAAVTTPGAASPDSYEVETITLAPNRFIPAALTLPHRKFLLVVNNRAQLETMNLSLARINGGGKLKEAAVARKNNDFNDFIDLPPGDYLLTEANTPQASCRITITTQR